MKISEHLEKAAAFERALARLDALADGELYAVFLMRAGTNRLNAALHALGITTDGAATREKPGDLNHTYKPRLDTPLPETLKETFVDLAYIENLRPDYVRGPRKFDAPTARKAQTAYEAIRRATDAVLKERAHDAG